MRGKATRQIIVDDLSPTIVSARDPNPGLVSVGPPGDRHYRQGVCEVCGILLAGRYPIRRDRCGEHQQEELEL